MVSGSLWCARAIGDWRVGHALGCWPTWAGLSKSTTLLLDGVWSDGAVGSMSLSRIYVAALDRPSNPKGKFLPARPTTFWLTPPCPTPNDAVLDCRSRPLKVVRARRKPSPVAASARKMGKDKLVNSLDRRCCSACNVSCEGTVG